MRRANRTPAEKKDEEKIKRAATKAAKQAANAQNVAELVPRGDVESDDDVDNLFDEHEFNDISSNTRSVVV